MSLTYCVTDAEFDGPRPGENSMLAFATVAVIDGAIGPSFEAVLAPLPGAKPDPGTLAWFETEPEAYAFATRDPRPAAEVMKDFVAFVRTLPGTPVFASHPLALDGVWFDHYLRRFTGYSIIAGHREKDPLFPVPAFCIASFLSGRIGWDVSRCGYKNYPPDWLGNLPHTHRAIDDALGYAHLLTMLLAIEPATEKGSGVMRVFVLYAHPVETSFNAALHDSILVALRAAGHDVDDCDLYRENFDPRLSREERLGYHDVGPNVEPVRSYVERLQAADGLVLSFPVWNFGFPAILKGFFDRVFLPGVSFDLTPEGGIAPKLHNIRKMAAVCTYGGSRLRAILAGDPPRKVVTRVLRATTAFAPCTYLARYDMNNATEHSCRKFLERVTKTMAAF